MARHCPPYAPQTAAMSASAAALLSLAALAEAENPRTSAVLRPAAPFESKMYDAYTEAAKQLHSNALPARSFNNESRYCRRARGCGNQIDCKRKNSYPVACLHLLVKYLRLLGITHVTAGSTLWVAELPPGTL